MFVCVVHVAQYFTLPVTYIYVKYEKKKYKTIHDPVNYTIISTYTYKHTIGFDFNESSRRRFQALKVRNSIKSK